MPVALAAFDRPLSEAEISALPGVPEPRLRWTYGPLMLAYEGQEDWMEEQSQPPDASGNPSSRERLSAAVQGRGGRWFPGDRGDVSPWLSCRAPTDAEATQLAVALEEFTTIESVLPGIRPPWVEASSAGESAASEALARHTVAIAMHARFPQMNSSGMARMLLTSVWRGARGKRDAASEVRRNVQAALAKARAEGPIDEEVARILEADPLVMRKQTRSALAERCGAAPVPAGPRRGSLVAAFSVERHGPEVALRLNARNRDGLEANFPRLLGWFCSRQCTDPRVSVESHRLTRTAQRDD